MRDTRPPGAPPPKGNRGVGEVGEEDEVGEGSTEDELAACVVGPEDEVGEMSTEDELAACVVGPEDEVGGTSAEDEVGEGAPKTRWPSVRSGLRWSRRKERRR